MFSRLKNIISSFRNAGHSDTELQGYAPETVGVDPWERLAEQPLSIDAQLAVANQRLSEEMVRQRIRENVQRFRESNDNPASLWALSFVDPFDWAMDTPDFYPGLGMGGGGWGVPWLLNKQGRGDFLPVYINEMGLKLIRDWSRRICAFNEFALNALENRISYIIGKGFQYSVVEKQRSTTPAQSLDNEEGTEPSRLAELAQAVLDEFISRERWNEREQEVVKRCDRDGEAFLRFFHIGGGRTAVRFVEPEYVTQGQSYQAGEKQADDIWRQYGVNSEPGDIEDVQSYSVVENPIGNWMTRDVPASEMLHIKVNTDFDSKRGLPTLFPVRKNLERADKLLRNMSVMAQVQATFAVIRRHKQFGPSSVSAYQQAASDLNVTMPVSGRSLNMRQLQPGSIIDASDKTEYEFPSANVDASGLVAVLQAELRAIAARLVMPEFMLTVDASNANFASTMVAESPWVKKGERDQSFFARHFGDGEYGQSRNHGVMWKVLANAVEGGLLPRETLTLLEIQAEGPTLAVRDKEKETRRSQVLSQAGLLSDATWSKWEGLDHEQEIQQGAQPKQQQPAVPGMNGQGSAGFGSETPKPAPPGSAGGMSEGREASEGLAEEIKHVFGRCVDTSTHKVVPCPASGEDREKKNKASRAKKGRASVGEVVAIGNQLRRGRVSGEQMDEFRQQLERMTVKEIHEIKRQMGLKASGSKASLARKVAERALQSVKIEAAAARSPGPITEAARPDLSEEQEGALEHYTASAWINDELRTGVKPEDNPWSPLNYFSADRLEEVRHGLMGAFASAKVMDHPVKVFRGLKFKSKEEMENFTKSLSQGQNVVWAGYTSTTPDKEAAEGYMGHGEHQLMLTINAVKGLDLNHYGTGEKGEFLLNHNSEFKVDKIEREGGQTVITLTQRS